MCVHRKRRWNETRLVKGAINTKELRGAHKVAAEFLREVLPKR
jgi:hypothetical protein